MISEAVGFLLFSTIEGVGILFIMMAIFRMNPLDHIWPSLFIILLMSLQSFVLRNELELTYMVPVINILLFILLLTTVVKTPVLWSGIIAILGYMAFAIVQTVVVFTAFGSIANAQSTLFHGYSTQAMTAILLILISWFMSKNRMGFTFEFERLRLKSENTIVIVLMLIFLIIFSIIMIRQDIWLNIVFFGAALMMLIYYAIREERFYD
ncbi:hypothetical protein [Paenibacillus sp. S150]|uniref:hypothetical protein n=1 Tax=Paenibacillus sp. S150 TaxID=2749826 RepID=UPI001C58809A|nr:hypothetical protein [Paenibacillus sp. S150]MBW4083560.1 hypothetical protein [Paenibacillus sp. S150]